MVSHQDKSRCIEQRSQTDGLADLRGFVDDAEIKPPTCKNGMFDAHTGSPDHQLDRDRRFVKFVVPQRVSQRRRGNSNLFVVKLLQLRQCLNSLLPHTLLCVGQDVWMNLEEPKTQERSKLMSG